jgi:DNA-binding protein Fis
LIRSAALRKLSLREIEDLYIDEILEATGGNKVQAAKVLGIDRKTLYRRAERTAAAAAGARA